MNLYEKYGCGVIRITALKSNLPRPLHTALMTIDPRYEIEIPSMEEKYVHSGRRKFRGSRPQATNLYHFRVEELENRFDEVSKELLICISSFSPANQFSSFDIRKLRRLAKFYPNEFSTVELSFMENSLRNFIVDIQSDDRFSMLINENTGKHKTHSRVYLLLKLVLLLPVSTTSVERAFSRMATMKKQIA
ncbi:hypothetical protein RND81_04G070100 [Saponaria officinalis]|uniref:HAT C-terminal dimerisation domain-containing protein n=1 Tax=Saponaria officinalis TaxID=3572 RepID=A0AAW1LJM1_SAPOF